MSSTYSVALLLAIRSRELERNAEVIADFGTDLLRL